LKILNGWKSTNISAKDAIPEIKAKVKVLKPTDKQWYN
jgi:hypothetical protein